MINIDNSFNFHQFVMLFGSFQLSKHSLLSISRGQLAEVSRFVGDTFIHFANMLTPSAVVCFQCDSSYNPTAGVS